MPEEELTVQESIAEQILNIHTTKKLLRRGLNLLGANLDKDDAFRTYATKALLLSSDLPTLNAPSVSNNDGNISFTDNSNNGNFTTKFALYVDGNWLVDVNKGSSVNLYDYILADGTYSITAKALGTLFNASAASSAVSVTLSGCAGGYRLVDNTYGKTIEFLAKYRSEDNTYGKTLIIESEEE